MEFRTLAPEELPKFRQWARENYTPGDSINELWHPAVRSECDRMNVQAGKVPVAASTIPGVRLAMTLSLDRIRDLLCSAFEGGSNYWYMIARYELAPGLLFWDFCEKGKMQDPKMYWHPAQLVPTTEGCALAITVKDENLNPDDAHLAPKEYRLDLDALARGAKVMQEKHPQHFLDVLNENDDATTGDVFLQCCLFGELLYG